MNEKIVAMHQKLAALNPRALFLLGGSFVRGEERIDSDIDFYALVPWWSFIAVYKTLKSPVKDIMQSSSTPATCMFIPTILGRPLSLYYLHAKDVNGKLFHFANRRQIVCNAIKLALFNFVRYLALPDQKERSLRKCARQLAAAQYALSNGSLGSDDVFSENFLQQKNMLVATNSADVQKQLLVTAELFLKSARFSLRTFLYYNALFLFWRRPLLLRGDPDIIVTRQMVDGLKRGANPPDLYESVQSIVFPVIML